MKFTETLADLILIYLSIDGVAEKMLNFSLMIDGVTYLLWKTGLSMGDYNFLKIFILYFQQ